MGIWGYEPWGNDKAADFFGDLFEHCNLRELVVSKLKSDVTGSNHQAIRAAALILIFLGRNYVWPIRSLKADIELTIARLSELLEDPDIKGNIEYEEPIRHEIEILKARNDKSHSINEATRRYWETLI
jgi:uncharacterized protein DUF4259